MPNPVSPSRRCGSPRDVNDAESAVFRFQSRSLAANRSKLGEAATADREPRSTVINIPEPLGGDVGGSSAPHEAWPPAVDADAPRPAFVVNLGRVELDGRYGLRPYDASLVTLRDETGAERRSVVFVHLNLAEGEVDTVEVRLFPRPVACSRPECGRMCPHLRAIGQLLIDELAAAAAQIRAGR